MKKAIQTTYAGYRFRSRLEARWARFLDFFPSIEWEYEPEGFSLPDGNYLPDFRVHLPGEFSHGKDTFWLEIKPTRPEFGSRELTLGYQLEEETEMPFVLAYGSFDGDGPKLATERTAAWRPCDPRSWEPPFCESAGPTDWGRQLSCPLCGFDYVHVEDARFSIEEYNAWAGGGEAALVNAWCENGCRWTYTLGFHKGYSFFTVQNCLLTPHTIYEIFGKDAWQAVEAARAARFEHGEQG